MDFSLERIFSPVTSAPPALNGIAEIAPCDALKPYVRCFWISSGKPGVRVIPDMCGDIIIPLKENSRAVFCAAGRKSFLTEASVPQFGIRFFAWAAPLFLQASASQLLDRQVPACDVFARFSPIETQIKESSDLSVCIEKTQDYLISLLSGKELNPVALNALSYAAARECRISVDDMARHCAVSARTLERNILQSVGMTPRQMLGLVRYQLLWQECIRPEFSGLDCTSRFGFFDQAHLCNSFKSYHGISPGEARAEFLALMRSFRTASARISD